MKGLTKRQIEIVSFIKKYIDEHRYSPSFREIKEHFKFSSLGSVHKHIETLKRKGQIMSEKQSSRSLYLTHETSSEGQLKEMQLPFIGNITTEKTIETFPQIQTIAVPASLVSSEENTYVLRVRGENLNDELIGDGDLLIVEARQNAYSGELVMALAPNHEVIVKRYYPEGNHVRLKGHGMEDSILIKSEEFYLQGVVVGLLRFFL